jgi:hypothetical protein
MSKPYIHAQSSVKKHGGTPEDYLAIHEWFDQTKAFLPDQRHRALLHSSFGIFLCAQVFGKTFVNSAGTAARFQFSQVGAKSWRKETKL